MNEATFPLSYSRNESLQLSDSMRLRDWSIVRCIECSAKPKCEFFYVIGRMGNGDCEYAGHACSDSRFSAEQNGKRADEQWGVKWEDLAKSIRCYALGDVKHGHLVWTTVLGCLLRDFFPDPESALYLTGPFIFDDFRVFNFYGVARFAEDCRHKVCRPLPVSLLSFKCSGFCDFK